MRALTISLVSLLTFSWSVCAKPVTVEHPAGTTVVEKMPQRVAVIGAGVLDMLDYFGVDPVVVNHDFQPDFLKKYTSGAYPSAGTLFEPDYEQIYTQKPDLIITGPRLASKHAQLSEIAPTIVLSPHATDGYWLSTQQQWRYLGQIFDVSEKVETTISRLDKEFKKIKQYNLENPSKALTVLSSGGNISAFSTSSRFSSVYHDFGFEYAVQQKLKNTNHGDLISFEFISKINPEYLFIIDGEKLRDKQTDKTSKAFDNDLIKKTIAYNKDQVAYLNLDAWYLSMGGVRATENMIKDIKTVLKLD